MKIEIRADDVVVVKIEVDSRNIRSIISGFSDLNPKNPSRSHPMTSQQAKELLTRIDQKSVVFLSELALRNGSISWGRMKAIFGIVSWTEFSASYGKGITRAFRNIVADKHGRLVVWEEDEWPSEDDFDTDEAYAEAEDNFCVHVEGEALTALKIAANV